MKDDLAFVFASALILAAVGTPVMRRVALRFDVIDRPLGRKRHVTPTPLLGGVALWAAVLGALLLQPERAELVQVGGIAAGATWISFWGLWDDRRGLGAATKLAAQVSGAVLLMLAGVHVALPIPFWFNAALTVLWVVGITNAMNLLDNMDGLSSGVGAVAAACFLLLAALNGQYLVGSLAAAVLGACLGFLIYNTNPARIFMGDSGSMFLGFVLAALGIKLRFPGNTPWVTWMVPILVLGLPVADTSLVVLSRLRRRRNPLTTPGHDHISHRLVRLGWTPREAVLLLYTVGFALGGVAVFVSLAEPFEAWCVAAVAALVAGAAIVWLEWGASPGDEPRHPSGQGRTQ